MTLCWKFLMQRRAEAIFFFFLEVLVMMKVRKEVETAERERGVWLRGGEDLDRHKRPFKDKRVREG